MMRCIIGNGDRADAVLLRLGSPQSFRDGVTGNESPQTRNTTWPGLGPYFNKIRWSAVSDTFLDACFSSLARRSKVDRKYGT